MFEVVRVIVCNKKLTLIRQFSDAHVQKTKRRRGRRQRVVLSVYRDEGGPDHLATVDYWCPNYKAFTDFLESLFLAGCFFQMIIVGKCNLKQQYASEIKQ